nr:hypothetical protein [Tanacetum cinerariifolium]
MVKKVDDMTIAEYIEYEESMKRQYSRNSRSYFPTYSGHCTSSNNTTIEFSRNTYFNPIQPNTKFNYDSEDIELDEEARYTTNEELVMSEHEAIDPPHTVNTLSFGKELSSEEDLDKWLKVEIEKHMSRSLCFETEILMNVTPPDAYSDGTLFGDTTPTVTPPTTHIHTTLIPAEIPNVSPIIPSSPDYTLVSLDYSPLFNTKFDPSKDPSSDHIPPLPATSPFLSSTDDSSDSDTPDTPPSPTHGTPFTEITLSTQRSPAASGALCPGVMILAPGESIPYGRPYGYHPNEPVYMMTARKRVRLLRTHCLTLRHSVYYSSSYPFTSDDSLETSLDSSINDLSDSSSGHSSLDHSSPVLPLRMRSSHQLCSLVPSIPYSSAVTIERPCHSSFTGPSRKRSRSPITFVLRSSTIPEVLPPAYADLLPPRKRIRSSDSATYLEDCLDESLESSLPRETSLRDDVVVRGSVLDDVPKPAQDEGAVKVTYETLGDLRDQWHGIVATGQHCAVLLERISKLEQDNTRLRGTLDVTSQTMTNTRSGATMTRETVNELIEGRVAEELEAHDDTRNLKHLVEGRGEQGDENGDDYEGRNRGVNGNRRNGNGRGNDNRNDNGNGNGNEGGNGYNFGGLMPVAKECTYQDFLKYQPLNFNRTEGVVGLTRWLEKMETKIETELWNLTVKGNDLTAYTRRFQELVSLCTRMVLNEEDKRTLVGNQWGIVCYECGRPRHFRKDYPKLKNKNRRNKTGNKVGNKTGSNEATAKAYAIGGGANPDSNVVTSTFLLNNCYASMLFNSDVDRSFVSSTFSALLDVAPSTLDTSYAVELVDGRIS